VRRALALLARELRLSEEDAGRAAIVATELATNLVRHTPGGEVVLRARDGALDIIAWDRGPGIPDVERSLTDGFSTAAGGSGTGLGAVRRVADSFELSSVQPSGTVILATVVPDGARRARSGNEDPGAAERGLAGYTGEAAGLVLALAPETVSGDAWGACSARNGDTILLADGLGHGPGAAEASERAVAALHPGETVDSTLERVHGELRPTRGAAVAVAQVDTAQGVVHFAGVGNIAAAICERGSTRSLASMAGTAGRQIRTLRVFDYELPASGFLVMHSDGCRSGWSLDADPRLRRRSPLMIAATLIRDWERGRDDVSMVVLPLARG
jgi:anti-sigma regulatory factor (Ser/Thr protein kinase)